MSKERDVPRRTALRAGLGAVGLAGLASRRASAATIPVTGGGGTLQTAIDGANPGDTIVVEDSATYDPITVDMGVTVTTAEHPTIAGTGGISNAVGITADGVELSGFRITNDGGLIGVKVEPATSGTRQNVLIGNNRIENLGPTGFLGVSGVVVGNGNYRDIQITANTISGLENEINDQSQFGPTVNGVLFDAAAPSEQATNCEVTNNRIRNLTSDIAPLGIVLQHDLVDVAVNNNAIAGLRADPATDSTDADDNLSQPGVFAQGINVGFPGGASTTQRVDVNSNRIESITTAGPSSITVFEPEAVKIGPGTGVSGIQFRANSLLTVVGFNNAASGQVDARNNYWGVRSGPEFATSNLDASPGGGSDVVGPVRVRPPLPNDPNRGRGQGGGGGPP